MPARLFSLRHVPEDEADGVRALLAEHGIEYFESVAGFWGISAPAIWLLDADRLGAARALIDAYQRERTARVRAEYREQKSAGRQRTVFDVMRENPLRFVVYLAAIAAILYFSVKPFLNLGK